MAFRLPSSNWQELRGFERVPDSAQCCVCGSTHDLGRHPEQFYCVCRQHANMQPVAVTLVVKCCIEDSQISKAVFDAGRWNSYDREAMLPHFSDELLVEHTELTLNNCSRIRVPASTYDEAIQLYATELANRLRAKTGLPPSNVSEEGVTELVFQPLECGESCVADVVLDDESIERYEVRRMDL